MLRRGIYRWRSRKFCNIPVQHILSASRAGQVDVDCCRRYAYTLDSRVTWSAMKCASADIRSRYTELTAATARIPIQTPKKPTVSAVSAEHSKNPRLLTVSHGRSGCVNASGAARCSARGSRENQKRYAIVCSVRAHGTEGGNNPAQWVGWKARKLPATGEFFSLDSLCGTNPELSIAMSLPGVEFFY
jgi:hypothetical protein